MAKRGLVNNNIDPYIYYEAANGNSRSLGIDASNNGNLKMSLDANPNVSPSTSYAWLLDRVNNVITMPNQPSFLATINAEADVSGDNTIHYVGSVTATTEEVDRGNHFFPGDGAGNGALFTAPVAGLYIMGISYQIEVNTMMPAGGDFQLWSIVTTSYTYRIVNAPTRNQEPNFYGINDENIYTGIALVTLDATDTVQFAFQSGDDGAGGTKTDDINGGYLFGCLLV